MRVLITVTTYPQPSHSYDELVCTAGILEDGSWLRIYPVPFKFLEFRKYQWIELDLIRRKRSQDFRPESYRPREHDLSDMKVVSRLYTAQSWLERKEACLRNGYTNMTSLIAASQSPGNVSLAAFRPTRIKRFVAEDAEPEWKPEWLERLRQTDLMTGGNPTKPRVPIRKIPYSFKYEFEDEDGRSSTVTIEDWEIGALYWNCLDRAQGDESLALAKVRQKYEDEFLAKKDITLFLGTTLEHQRRRQPIRSPSSACSTRRASLSKASSSSGPQAATARKQ